MNEKNDTPTPAPIRGEGTVIDEVACDMVIAAFQYLSDIIRKFAEEHKDELNKMIREEMSKKGPSNG